MRDFRVDCVLCGGGSEILQHLCYECDNAKQVWEGVFSFLDNTMAVNVLGGGNQNYDKG